MSLKADYPDLFNSIINSKVLLLSNGRSYLLNSLTDHVPPTQPNLLREAVNIIKSSVDLSRADILVGDEERGGFLIPCIALDINKPFILAKQAPTGFNQEITATFPMAYHPKMKLYISAQKKNTKVILIDDIVDTGGTLVAMIQTLRKASTKIVDVVTLMERTENNGIKRIKDETGITVKSLIKINIYDNNCHIVS